jgi:hypothetical protein
LRIANAILAVAFLILSAVPAGAIFFRSHGGAGSAFTIPAGTFSLKNPSGSVGTGAHEVRWGQAFLQGVVLQGNDLKATINGSDVSTQLDCKVTWTDSTCRWGIVTIAAPNVPASTTYGGTLATAARVGSPMNMAHACDAWAETVTIAISGGSTYAENVCTLLATALAGGECADPGTHLGCYTTWLSGPVVTEIRFDTYLTSSLRLTIDLAYHADGSVRTDAQMNNDAAMTGSGGDIVFTESIVQNSVTVVNYGTAAAPTIAAANLGYVSGGALGSRTYFVKVTYKNAAGETLPSNEVSIAIPANNVLVVQGIDGHTGATTCGVYVSTTTGTETNQGNGATTLQTGTGCGFDPNYQSWQEPTTGLVAGASPPGSSTMTQTLHQYQTRHDVVWSNGAPAHQIIYDMDTFQKAGLFHNYDLQWPQNLNIGTGNGGAGPTLAEMTALMAAPSWGGVTPFNGLARRMEQEGARSDIGPTTGGQAMWIITQDPIARTFASQQAEAAGSWPTHFYDPTTGHQLSEFTHTTFSLCCGAVDLTQAMASTSRTGLAYAPDHHPDLSYVTYLLTGDHHQLDELNALANSSVLYVYTGYRSRAPYTDLVVNGTPGSHGDQTRQQAWALRDIDEAAAVNPVGTDKTYFTQLAADNWSQMLGNRATWTALQGDTHGWIQDDTDSSTPWMLTSPWAQDYFASSVAEAVALGITNASTVSAWNSNYLIQRFFPHSGWNQHDSSSYRTILSDGSSTYASTWAMLESNTVNWPVVNVSNGSCWSYDTCSHDGDYQELAFNSVAELVSVTGSVDAMQAYAWQAATNAPFLWTYEAAFQIRPRMPDGKVIYYPQIQISLTGNVTLTSSGGTSMLATAGTGNDTLNGGTGSDLLYAGTTGTQIVNAGTGSQYMFGCLGCATGTTKFVDNIGNNFMRGSTSASANTYEFGTNNSGQDTIDNFRPGTDILRIKSTLDGGSFADAAAFTATCTVVGGTKTVCSPGGINTITLNGVTTDLTASVVIF